MGRPPPKAAIPDGWVLVPSKPTPAMLAAGEAMADECRDGDTDTHSLDDSIYSTEYLTADAAAKIFEAMIRAAPSHSSAPHASDKQRPTLA